MTTRTTRAALADETLRVLDAGHYTAPDGTLIDLAADVRNAVAATQTIYPGEWPEIVKCARALPRRPAPARIEVTGETTLEALSRLMHANPHAPVAALNFASAKNPGGGFLGGSQAQEESIARASALYPTLVAQHAYYRANREKKSLLYTDHAILSPRTPVFRDDTGTLLARPFFPAFITMPAPNLGAIPEGHQDRARVPETLRRRIDFVLALAASRGLQTLVLGAWGCGVFRNEPDTVAALFAEALSGPASWRDHFDRLVFAVYDRAEPFPNRAAFECSLFALTC